jgi:hypothetical protein
MPLTIRAQRIAAAKLCINKEEIPITVRIKRLLELALTTGLGRENLQFIEKKLLEFRAAAKTDSLHMLLMKVDEVLEVRRAQEKERRSPRVAGRKTGRPRKQAEAPRPAKKPDPPATPGTLSASLADLIKDVKLTPVGEKS